MQLIELYTHQPPTSAHHLCTTPLTIAIHPSTHYLAYATRNNQLVFHNRRTGRTVVLWRSEHGIVVVVCTEKYVLVVERGRPEVLVFSIKAEKLKKKITGHRSQVLCVAYCPQRQIFCTASHDVCFIWDQPTLQSLKLLKCSTSSYTDCNFSPSGQHLFTSFTDGNIFTWPLDSYTPKQSALSIEPHRLASTANQFLLAYTGKKISVADYSQELLVFEEVEPFWEGELRRVDFLGGYLVVRSSLGFYVGEIVKEHRVWVRKVRELVEQIYDFVVAKYASQLVIISKDLTKIRGMRIYSQGLSQTIPLTNPLINPGNQCIGGYSNQQGCITPTLYPQTTHPYSTQTHKLQPLNPGPYHTPTPTNPAPSLLKLTSFLHKHHTFPDKYRQYAYQHLLHLPINKDREQFKELERKGWHGCVGRLDRRYRIGNLGLMGALKDVVSLLGHYCEVFAESQLVPGIVFPFVCIFGQDRFFCFQVLYRLFTTTLPYLFQTFPLANSPLLQNLLELFQSHDQPLLNHLQQHNISFTKLTWTLLSTLFTQNLNRDGFLAVVDTLVGETVDGGIGGGLVVFLVMGYLEYNRGRIMGMKSEADLDIWLDEQHTVNISTFITKSYQLHKKYHKKLHYHFPSLPNPTNQTHYTEYPSYPTHAVKLYQTKRLLQLQQQEKCLNDQRYHHELVQETEKMITKIKREADMAEIESEALVLQAESQAKVADMPVSENLPSLTQRKKHLNTLLTELQHLITTHSSKTLKLTALIPHLSHLSNPNTHPSTHTDHQLQQMQHKLMSLLCKLQPNFFKSKIAGSHPLSLAKEGVENFEGFKAAKMGQLANRFWEVDRGECEGEGGRWEEAVRKANDY